MIFVNGDEMEENKLSQKTLKGLLDFYEVDSQKIAIEKNGIIIPREKFQTEEIHNEDRIEIIHFVGGG